jgi:hypothetical protein
MYFCLEQFADQRTGLISDLRCSVYISYMSAPRPDLGSRKLTIKLF